MSFLTCLLFNTALLPILTLALWPLPQEYQHGSTMLWLSPNVQTIYTPSKPIVTRSYQWDKFVNYVRYLMPSQNTTGIEETREATHSAEVLLQAAGERLLENVRSQAFVPWKFHPRNASFEPKLDDERSYIHFIEIVENQNVKHWESRKSVSDESYSLRISETGNVLINIIAPIGGIRALETLSQLFYRHSDPIAGIYTPYAPVSIRDSPAFKHRGLNLDISRNIISPQDVMRTLDGMSFNKFNRLHLHASDSQSWPLEIPALPDLAAKGAYHPSQIWSTADLEEVQVYGAYRGIEVHVEFDMPGHTASIFHSNPSLITAFNQQPWTPYSAEPPSGELLLNSTSVSTFLTTLLSDLLPRISPYTTLFHLGGDELNTLTYTLDPTVTSSSPSILQPLLQSLTNHLLSLVKAHNLTPIFWEEQLLDWNLTLPQNSIIQTWRSPGSLASVLQKGHYALFGDHTHWYLDCGHGTFLDPNRTNPDSSIHPPYLDYCAPYKNWREVYSYDPLADIPSEEHHLVLGGEVHLWGELTDGISLDGTLWPRAAAAAEVMWRGGGREVGEEVTRRLAEMREGLLGREVRAGMVQMTWCLMNKGGCTA